jgi:hypothetical protein
MRVTGLDAAIVVVAAVVLGLLLMPGLRQAPAWRAMVTPLASIIGSGFLVIAPVMASVSGSDAVRDMALIILAAWLIGGVIRFNILHAEPGDGGSVPLLAVSALSELCLSAAYVISTAFYIRLLASFALSQGHWAGKLNEDLLATAILAAIGLIGWARGLKGLERVEVISVSVKLAIIAALLVALSVHDAGAHMPADGAFRDGYDGLTRLRMLMGMLLVVQGFETSRYLSQAYSRDLRRRSMAWAQGLSGVIYIAFLALVLPMLPGLSGAPPDETAIIGLAAQAAAVMAPLLIVAAVMSQLSAAVADTLGAGGLVAEETRGRLSQRAAYPLLVALAIALIWAFDIFEVIAIASRAFATYYALQAVIAVAAAWKVHRGWRRAGAVGWFVLMALALAAVALFALPVE